MSKPTPYALMARAYYEAGWSPLPLPPNQKSPVPNGYTGASGAYVTETDVDRWLSRGRRARVNVGKLNYAPGNVALRLPRNVIGVDVDAHSGKSGLNTFTAALADWGPLPATWVTTSKQDGVSGIRLYRIPEGLAWPGELPQGKGVELLRWDHRFAIVHPSLHDKTGDEYGWYHEAPSATAGVGGLVLVASPDDFPTPGELPELPAPWVEGLTSGQRWEERAAADISEAEASTWLASCVEPDDMCAYMRKTVSTHTKLLRRAGEDGGAHDSMRDAAWAVLGDGNDGHGGVTKALGKLRDVFLAAVRERRGDERQAREEWRRAVFRGIAKVVEGGGRERADPCISVVSLGDSAAPIYEFTEFANAQRLARVMNGRARWVTEFDRWYIWDTVRWHPDSNGQVRRWAWKAVALIDEEIGNLGGTADEDTIAEFKKHKKNSSKDAAIGAMVRLVRDRPGITISAVELDANYRLLNCPNGTATLAPEGIGFTRVQREEDYLTGLAGAPYDPDATSGLWDKFLLHAVPDEEMRDWLQKLVGYSLLGRNTERLFVAVYGPTSTGKTTFAETLRVALGTYAASVNLSVFRDNQDERARADLVRALGKRIVFAEEASSSWHLHPDQVKRLTGGSEITARLPYGREYLEAIPPFTPWLFTNATPSIEGADEAFWRRIRVVPFKETIPVSEEDNDLLERLQAPEARAAVLAWALRGWERYREDPTLEQPAATWGTVEEFRAEASDFDRCIADIAVRDAEAHELGRDLYLAYQQWCENRGIKPESETKLGKYLSGVGVVKKPVKIEGKPQTPRVGIRLRKEWKNMVK